MSCIFNTVLYIFYFICRTSTGPMDTCSYFSFLSLDEIAEHSEQGSVLVSTSHLRLCLCHKQSLTWFSHTINISCCFFFQTVYMSVDKLNRFTNTSLMPPEQHFYPSALAFSKSTVLSKQELFDLLLLHT